MASQDDALLAFLQEQGVPLVTKARHEYLSYYGLDQASVYVLAEGVVKASVILRDGREFNISYIKGPNPVSLLRDEVSTHAEAPFNVRVESEMASYLVVPRVTFWSWVNERPELLAYVKDYYRGSLEDAMRRLRYLTMNGKTGAVGAMLYELAREFGEPCAEGVRIDLAVTNEDIAGCCGISSRTSVNRIVRGLRERGVVATNGHDPQIVVRDMDYLRRFVLD